MNGPLTPESVIDMVLVDISKHTQYPLGYFRLPNDAIDAVKVWLASGVAKKIHGRIDTLAYLSILAYYSDDLETLFKSVAEKASLDDYTLSLVKNRADELRRPTLKLIQGGVICDG